MTVIMILGAAFIAAANEYFVSGKHGNDTNVGSKQKPFQTIAKATRMLVPGDTLFIREGTYREFVRLEKKATLDKPILVRNYKEEKVIVKGSDLFSMADFREIDMPGFDKNNSWAKKRGRQVKILKKDNFPVNPTQVFVDGVALMQIGDDATSVALDGNWTRLTNGSSVIQLRKNSFFYDTKTKILYLRLGRKLTPKSRVEISMRQSLLTTGTQGEYIHIKGITFMHTSTLGNPYGGKAVVIGTNCTLEDSVVKWCGGIGVHAVGKNPKVINCELAFNGNTGFNANKTENFLVKNCRIHHNNYRDYNRNWHTGGMKMIPDTSGIIENCKIYNNYGYGIWFDNNTSKRQIIIRGNTISNNIGGIYLELTHNALVENNFVIYNSVFGIMVYGSNTTVRNNTIANNSGYCSLGFLPRKKRKYRPEKWNCRDNVIMNNLFMDNRTRIEIHLPADDKTSDVCNYKCDNNSFIRIGGSKFRYTVGAVDGKTYKNIFDNGHFSQWKQKTGFDKNSYYWEGNIGHRFSKPTK
jgi:parallel beta-helix repeat protein